MTDNNIDREARRRQNRKIIRSSTWVSLAGVGLFLISGALIYKLMPSPFEQQLEAINSHTEPNLSITMVQRDASGQWKRLDHIPASGEQISFRVTTNQPLHVSLLNEPNHSRPRTLFDHIRIPPGENRIINFNNADYHYTVKAHDKHVLFCLVTAADAATLTTKLIAMQKEKHLDVLPDKYCVNW